MIIGYFLLLFVLLVPTNLNPIDPPTRYSLLKELTVDSSDPPLVQQSVDGRFILTGAGKTLTIYKNSVKQKKNGNNGVQQYNH